MKLKLNGKTALVTASTAGIGLAIARQLYVEGARVIVNGRTQTRVDEALRLVREEKAADGAEALGFAADLASPEGQAALLKAFPKVDILVNNLGVYESKAAAEITAADWNRMFTVNVLSGALLSQAYLQGMRANDWGRIIFVASESGVMIPPDMIHYGVSKAAQIALGRGLAETTAGTGVTVNSVLPGPTLSEGIGHFLEQSLGAKGADRAVIEKEFIAKNRPTSLLRRFIKAEEVASLVAYLASPLAAATNGASVRVEGGLVRSPF